MVCCANRCPLFLNTVPIPSFQIQEYYCALSAIDIVKSLYQHSGPGNPSCNA